MISRRHRALPFCVALLAGGIALAVGSGSAHASSATNIILLIGDGMGFEQIKAGRAFIGSNLVFESWSNNAQVRTYSASVAVTDSAAAGTAIATGHKVYNTVVSLAAPGDGHYYETVLEYLQRQGKRTGLVTVTAATDATPAVFAAHVTNRAQYARIAAHYLDESRPHVIMGAGGALNVSNATAAGYAVATNRESLLALSTSAADRVAGVFGTNNIPYEFDGVGDLPHLSEMTTAALALLSPSTNGFFLMVEGGAIDLASHINNTTRLVHEMAEFDRAARVVFDWASNRTDTLLLVTADHETGGLRFLVNNGPQQIPTVSWTTTSHTSSNVAFFAWGPGSESVSGIMDNTDVYRTMMRSQTIPISARHLQITPGGAMQTRWDAPLNANYALEVVDSLAQTNWTVRAAVSTDTHVVTLTDPTPPETNGFYRLRGGP